MSERASTAIEAVAPVQEVASRDPVSGETWRRFEASDAAVVDDALSRARAAQPAWAALSLRTRARVASRFHDALFARRAEVTATIRREMGKPAHEAMAAEVSPVLSHARWIAREAPHLLAPRRLRVRGLAHLRKRVTLSREPHGVVGVVSPWNYPLLLAAGHALPALVAGNAVLLKPSEHTTVTGLLLAELLYDAGVPRDVLHVLPGAGGTGATVVERCDMIFFTGSEATGRRIAHACAERLVPCSLELGGSDPAIVLDDAPVAEAVAGVLWGRFSNCGQSCVAPKRLYVVDAIHERFVAALAARVAALRVGDPDAGAEVGPPVHPGQHAALRAQLDDALARGARIAARADVPDASRYAAPVLLADVPADARVLREETFGPILPVVRVRDADEAVRLANASSFGLSASVWGSDLARAEAVARRLEAGTVMVNETLAAAGMAEVPHGGVKASGFGRAHGTAGLEECTRTRVVVTERMPRLVQPWWFGYVPELARQVDAFVAVEHAPTLRERLAALPDALPLLRRLRLR